MTKNPISPNRKTMLTEAQRKEIQDALFNGLGHGMPDDVYTMPVKGNAYENPSADGIVWSGNTLVVVFHFTKTDPDPDPSVRLSKTRKAFVYLKQGTRKMDGGNEDMAKKLNFKVRQLREAKRDIRVFREALDARVKTLTRE